MTANDIEEKWEYTKNPNQSVIINSDTAPSLFLHKNHENQRSLLLILNQDLSVQDHTVSKNDNIAFSIARKEGKVYVVITLHNSEYWDLFNDLIYSIYLSIRDIKDHDESYRSFVRTYHKWFSFFKPTHINEPSKEKVMGVFGELFVLRHLLQKNSSLSCNEILNSWQGPYNNAQDFILENMNIEVKTKLNNVKKISISSEHQLSTINGETIHLYVVDLSKDGDNLITLLELVNHLRDIINRNFGEFYFLIKGLEQLGLPIDKLELLNQYRFSLSSITAYDCNNVDFPKLTRANLPTGIHTVKYQITTTELSPYIINSWK